MNFKGVIGDNEIARICSHGFVGKFLVLVMVRKRILVHGFCGIS